MTTEAVVAVLAALGGGGFIIQILSAVKSWREGAKQKADEADERLVLRLERRIEVLELRATADAKYIRRLVSALGSAGVEIPEQVTD